MSLVSFLCHGQFLTPVVGLKFYVFKDTFLGMCYVIDSGDCSKVLHLKLSLECRSVSTTWTDDKHATWKAYMECSPHLFYTSVVPSNCFCHAVLFNQAAPNVHLNPNFHFLVNEF